jgi:hypothetical protein
MSRRMSVRVLALLLGLWTALVPAVVVGPTVAAKSAMEMSHDDASGDCDPCPAADADAEMCRLICLSVAPFVVSAEQAALPPAVHETYGREPGLLLLGRLPSIAPAPPKTA